MLRKQRKPRSVENDFAAKLTVGKWLLLVIPVMVLYALFDGFMKWLGS